MSPSCSHVLFILRDISSFLKRLKSKVVHLLNDKYQDDNNFLSHSHGYYNHLEEFVYVYKDTKMPFTHNLEKH
jgi:hypothetical protein